MGRSYLSAKEVIHRWHPLPFVRVPMGETSRKNLVSGTRCKGTYVQAYNSAIRFWKGKRKVREKAKNRIGRRRRRAEAEVERGGGEGNEETSAGEAANDLSDTVDR